MAKESGTGRFIGPVGNVSVYKMKGHDELILRTKGGPTKKQIAKSPSFAVTRKNNAEFGGCSNAGRRVRYHLDTLLSLADYNVSGPLNALMKHIQGMDTGHEHGQRSILLSQHARLLEGFNINRSHPFDTLVQNPVHQVMQKEKGMATVDIPALVPGLNFTVPGNFSHYRFILKLGALPDLHYTDNGPYLYTIVPNDEDHRIEHAFHMAHASITTDWFPTAGGSPAATHQLKCKKLPVNIPYTLMLAIGISFGNVRDNSIEAIQYAGAAKIVAIG